jgi:predicted PurR-regulated permease PerM
MIKDYRTAEPSGILTAAIVVAVIAVLYLAREILIPLAFAITLTLVLSPAVDWLQKLHLHRVASVFLVMTVSLLATGLISTIIFNQLVEVANEIPSYQENIRSKIQAMSASSRGGVGRAAERLKALEKELSQEPTAAPAPSDGRKRTPSPPAGPLPVEVVEPTANVLQSMRDLAQPFIGPLGTFGVILIFTVFLLIEKTELRNRLFYMAGLDRLNVMTEALDDATQRVSRYLVLQLLVNAIFGLLCGVGLYLIHVPYAVLWGAVAAILRIVPYVGSVVAGLLPLTLSLAVFDQWIPPLLVFLLFATLEIVTGNFVEPWLYGTHTGISSLALLLSTVCWTVLWGPAGLVLSTPLTVCVVVLGRHLPQLSFLHALLGDQPALAEDAVVYQRLLALDDHEARAVAGVYLKEHSLMELYDSVMIPALTKAEHDRHKGALEPTREEFLFLSMKEMLGEFAENAAAPLAVVAPKSTGRIFCLPASDEADEITAAMLAQLLEQAGHAALPFPFDPQLHNTVEFVKPDQKDLFCISALPPFAFSNAKTLCHRLRGRFPNTRIMVGVWGFSGDNEKALHRFHPSLPDKLVISLAEAIEFSREGVQNTPVAKAD